MICLALTLALAGSTIPTDDKASPCVDVACENWRQTADFWESEAYSTFDNARTWERRAEKANLEILSLEARLIDTSTLSSAGNSNVNLPNFSSGSTWMVVLSILGAAAAGLSIGLVLH